MLVAVGSRGERKEHFVRKTETRQRRNEKVQHTGKQLGKLQAGVASAGERLVVSTGAPLWAAECDAMQLVAHSVGWCG